MIKGGSGGGSTTTGLKFEKETSLEEALKLANFQVDGFKVYEKEQFVGELAPKHQLYKFLEAREVDWKSRVSKKLLPDEAFFTNKSKHLHIIEKKWQEVGGSVDEKLQTVGFKIRQYNKLLEKTGISVKFIYLLNDWFAAPSYSDVLEYIVESGGSYHFNSVPLEELEL
jgi:phosphoribulokinase